MAFLKRNILLFSLLLSSLISFSQPPNDSCAHAPMINIVNGTGFFTGTTAGATSSPSGTWVQTIAPCDTATNLKDVFWVFNTGQFSDYEITVNTGCNGLGLHLEVWRILGISGACTNGAFQASNECVVSSSKTTSITLNSLTINTDYYIRIGAPSGIPVALNGHIMALGSSNLLDATTTGNVDTNSTGKLWHNYLGNGYHYTISPQQQHSSIRIEVQNHDFDTLASNARLEFYLGDSVNVDSLVRTVDYLTESPYYTNIHTTGAVTVRTVSDPNIQVSEYALTWHIPDYAPSLFPNITICEGEDYNGYTMSGFYVDTVKASTGCDSVSRFNLSVLPTSEDTINVNICQGSDYNGWNSTGLYLDTLTAYNGCDSLQFVYLTIDSAITPTINMINDSTLMSSIAVNYQWFFDTIPLYSDTFQTINANQSGIYSVLTTDSNGCLSADTFQFIMVNTEKIANHQSLIDIVPNPNQGSFNLLLKDLPEGKWQISIYNITGQLIQSQMQYIYESTENIPVELENIGEGMYFLRLKNKDGMIITRKFIIKN